MKVHVNPDDLVQGTTDERGRIYLGPEHANAQITVAILDTDHDQVDTACANYPPCEGRPLPGDDLCPTCKDGETDA